ncbi:MAG: hypothetical protein ABJO88_00045 [Parasphingorhabdus sp.]
MDSNAVKLLDEGQDRRSYYHRPKGTPWERGALPHLGDGDGPMSNAEERLDEG